MLIIPWLRKYAISIHLCNLNRLTNIDENATSTTTPIISPHLSRGVPVVPIDAPATGSPTNTPQCTLNAIKTVADQFVLSVLGGQNSVGSESPQQ